MKVSEIYEKYKIMPQLQLHMLRVAAVSSLISNSFQKPIDKGSVISACLLHDIGNIVKFKLDLFPESLQPQGPDYWEKVKHEFIKKFGKDDHKATYKICKELGVITKVSNLIKAIGFAKAEKIYKSNSYDLKIVAYSDQRVAPFGITSLEQRHKEGQKRYIKSNNLNGKYNYSEYILLSNLLKKVEKQIFSHCEIKPEDITEEKVKPLLEKLKDFEIETSQTSNIS